MKNKHISGIRTILTRLLFISVPVLITVYFIMQNIYNIEVSHSRSLIIAKQEQKTKMFEFIAQSSMTQALNDINVLNKANEMTQYLQNPDANTLKELEQLFYRFSTNKPEIQRIRFVDLNGMERIRVSNDKVPIIAKEIELKDISNNPYFHEVKEHSNVEEQGLAYISPLELNKELEGSDATFQPIVRLAKAIYNDKNEQIGYLINDYDGTAILNIFKKYFLVEGSFLQASLINSDGFYLCDVQNSKSFAFMFEGQDQLTFDNEKPGLRNILTKQMGEVQFENSTYWMTEIQPINDSIQTFNKVSPWYIIMSFQNLDVNKIEGGALDVILALRIWMMIGSFVIILIGVLLYYFFYTRNEQLKLTKMIAMRTKDAVYVMDKDLKVTYVNDAFTSITGFTLPDVIDKVPRELDKGTHSQGYYEAMWNSIENDRVWTEEIMAQKKDGTYYPIQLSIIKMAEDRTGNIRQYFGMFNDLSTLKQVESKVLFLENYNNVTKLPNEQRVLALVEQKQLDCQKNLYIICFSIENNDKLKIQFDTIQYQAIINMWVKSIQNFMTGDDILGQLSEQKFILIKNKETVRTSMDIYMQELVIHSQRFVEVDGKMMNLKTHFGVADNFTNDLTIKNIIPNAIIAMDTVKIESEKDYMFYHADFRQKFEREMQIEARLKVAMMNNELSVVYQPQINPETMEMSCVEALIRWKNEELGAVSPMEFIPIAEKTGMIIEIGKWIVHKVFEDMRYWQKVYLHNVHVAINVSAVQFNHSQFFEMLHKASVKHGVDLKWIELEITESMLLLELDVVNEKLALFKRHQMSIAIDDFGTGFSSLSYLKYLQIDKLKIDRSFIKDYPEHDNGDISRIITDLAKTLNLTVVAEGVETEEQMLYLQKIGCTEIQGYFFSRPLPKAEFETKYLTNEPKKEK